MQKLDRRRPIKTEVDEVVRRRGPPPQPEKAKHIWGQQGQAAEGARGRLMSDMERGMGLQPSRGIRERVMSRSMSYDPMSHDAANRSRRQRPCSDAIQKACV